jgi:hypothetical protein
LSTLSEKGKAEGRLDWMILLVRECGFVRGSMDAIADVANNAEALD